MRRLICFLLALLLLAGLSGCMTAPAQQESGYDLPIVTQGEKRSTEAETASTLPSTEASGHSASTTEPAPDTEPVPATESAPLTEPATEPVQTTEASPAVTEDGVYDSKEEVALYIHLYGHLPSNYITKKAAESLGWPGGYLEPYAPGKCIGGSRFGNYEGRLPEAKGRTWTECDIGTLGARSRGSKRIVFSNDGLIYYTEDHYEHFELLYGKED